MEKDGKRSGQKPCKSAVKRQKAKINTGFAVINETGAFCVRRAFRRGADTFLALLLLIGAGMLAAGGIKGGVMEAAAPASPTSADEYTVAVDAGHGGSDSGAVGARTGVREAGLNLSVALMVEGGLRAQGFNVIMTRTDENAIGATKNEDMQERGRIINGEGVDLVVSVHMNKFTDPSVSGSMAFYMKGSAEGERLAQCVIDSVCDSTGQNRRLANPGDYYVIRECEAPSVLVECGFLSNAADEARLQEEEYQRLISEGIVAGVKAYLETAADN